MTSRNSFPFRNCCAFTLCLVICLAFFVPPNVAAQTTPLQLVNDSSRIVFLGDSITYQGRYVAEFDIWLQLRELENKPEVLNLGLPSETVSGLSEDGHAGGKFPRPDLRERLDRVLEKTGPDLVIACYGINCGIYQPFNEERCQKFQEGIQHLVDKVAFANADLILMTPPVYDDLQGKQKFSYDDVMKRYAEWMVAKGKEEEWHVVDLHSAMTESLRQNRLHRADFTLQPDAVHPNASGHRVIARTLIRAFESNYEYPQNMAGGMDWIGNRNESMAILRDAWLTETGHTRPGLAKGLSIFEAEKRFAEKFRSSEITRRWLSQIRDKDK